MIKFFREYFTACVVLVIALMLCVCGYNVFTNRMKNVKEETNQWESNISNVWFNMYKDSKEVSGSDIEFLIRQAEGADAKVLVKTLANRQGVEYSKDKKYSINDKNDDNYINQIAMFDINTEKDKHGKITKVILEQKRE